MKLSLGTWALACATVASVALVHFDPWRSSGDGGGFVSDRSAAKRVFPFVADHGPDTAEIVLQQSGGSTVRLMPVTDGHRLIVDDADVGPVDPEALEGLWSSLRLATTMRAVADDVDVGGAQRGTIAVTVGDRSRRVTVGGPTPEGAGLYGTIETDDGVQVWVVEQELAQILDQHPLAWLARRAVVVEPGQVTALRFSDAVLARGEDGLWRSELGSTRALLDTDAVQTRIGRLVGAHLDPILDPEQHPDLIDRSTAPWLRIQTTYGIETSLHLGGACPGSPDRVAMSRGPGWIGCVDPRIVRPWPVPGRGGGDDADLLAPRLAVHPMARVLAVDQASPRPLTLRRSAGGWVIEQRGEGPATVTDVGTAGVHRWYEQLHGAEVELVDDEGLRDPVIDVDLRVETDSTQTLRLRCGRVDAQRWCRRDDGPWLRVRDPAVSIAFDLDTFAERRLVDLDPGEARAIEILPGPGADVVRQSVRLDLGAWRLDAPAHPDGDAALSDVLLEELLAALSSLRAEAWVDAPSTEAERIVRVEQAPRGGQAEALVIRLHPRCIATVEGRAARLPEADCAALRTDLLHTDPLRAWVQRARTLELTRDGRTVRLQRRGEAWQSVDDDAVPDAVTQELSRLQQLRATALRGGDPPTPPTATLRVLPERGRPFVVQIGPDWAGLAEADWYYALKKPTP